MWRNTVAVPVCVNDKFGPHASLGQIQFDRDVRGCGTVLDSIKVP
jgi:hypothetical protein